MANYENLKKIIDENIHQNGVEAITGEILRQVLNNIVSSIGSYATFAGYARPWTNPGNPDQNLYYLATDAGIYPNFGGLELHGRLSVIHNTVEGNWNSFEINVPTVDTLIQNSSPIKNNPYGLVLFDAVVNIDGTITSNVPNWDYLIIPVLQNKNYTITGIPDNVRIKYAIFKNSYDGETVISYVDAGEERIISFLTPENCNYVCLDFLKSNPSIKNNSSVYENLFINCEDIASNENGFNYSISSNLFDSSIKNSGYFKESILDPVSLITGYVDENGKVLNLPGNTSWQIKEFDLSNVEVVRIQGMLPGNTSFAIYDGEKLVYHESYISDTQVDYIFKSPKKRLLVSYRNGQGATITDCGNIPDEWGRFNFIRCLSPFSTFNAVINIDGSITEGTTDWDYFMIPVKENQKYSISSPLIAKYILFYQGIPSQENLISYQENNYGKDYGVFTTPDNCKYVGIDLQKTGTQTSLSYYNNSFLLEQSKDFDLIRNKAENRIICFGDSITQGNYGRLVESYEYYLQESLMNYRVINCGVGGEETLEIAARQGGIPMYTLRDITLPQSGKVQIGNQNTDTAFYSTKGYSNNSLPLTINSTDDVTMEVGDTSRINPCTINGVECIFTTDSAGNQFLEKLNSDLPESSILPAKSIVFTHAMREYRDSSALIIYAGNNDKYTDVNDYTVDLIDNIRRMVGYSSTYNYIVVSQWSDYYRSLSDLIYIENALAEEFGSQMFNLRLYAITDGLQDAGIMPTPEDDQRIAQGLIPKSLTIDGLHPNGAMYKCMAKKFKEILINNGLKNG